MTTETMTVHKALAELKVIDNKINKAILSGKYVVANKHSNEKIGGVSVNAFKERMKDNYKKVTDLINRRNALKRAVVMSNAVTKVRVGNDEYTVAEAIDMKNHGMDYLRTLQSTILSQKSAADRDLVNNSGEAIERRAEKFILDTIQAQPKDSKMGVDSDAMKALRKDYISNNSYDLIDPLDVDKITADYEEQITNFSVEVDAALSVSNAITVITVEY